MDHLDLATARMKTRYGLKVELGQPPVQYREVTTRMMCGGGGGGWDDVWLVVEVDDVWWRWWDTQRCEMWR